jgi:hypothetical protein
MADEKSRQTADDGERQADAGVAQIVKGLGLSSSDKEDKILVLLRDQEINTEALGVLTVGDLTSIGITLGVAARLLVGATNLLRWYMYTAGPMRMQHARLLHHALLSHQINIVIPNPALAEPQRKGKAHEKCVFQHVLMTTSPRPMILGNDLQKESGF